jgi:UDP:flavonoid glycosyltransferase YjiC (YdhE family)
MLSWKDFARNPNILITMIKSIIETKSFYRRASELRDILNTYAASKIAADIIEKIMQK